MVNILPSSLPLITTVNLNLRCYSMGVPKIKRLEGPLLLVMTQKRPPENGKEYNRLRMHITS